jgi:uncharacterized protein (TIGR02145 family)
MKKLLYILLTIFLMSGIRSMAQDPSPLPSITVKKLIAPNNPVLYYDTGDSVLWVFKGATGWLRIATHQQLLKYYWTKYETKNYADSKISDATYSTLWNNEDSIGASKNAIYDKIETLVPVTYCPTMMTVNTGTLIQGVVSDLCAVGGTDVIIQEAAGADPLRVTFEFNPVQRLTSFSFYGRYAGGTTHVTNIEAYNYTAAEWQLVGELGNTPVKQWQSYNIFLPTNFISTGIVQVRFNHQGIGIPSHQLILDYVDVNYGGAGGSSFETASEIAFIPNGNIASTNVQAAIEELDVEKEPVFSKGNIESGTPAITVTNGVGRLVSGTATITIATGYSIPLTASQTTWENHVVGDCDTSCTNEIQGLTVSGTTVGLTGTSTTISIPPTELCDIATTATSIEYGALYNWWVVNDARNIANVGWHVPSLAEYTDLVNYIGSNLTAGGILKETGLAHWETPNTGATNEVGFNGRGGGTRSSLGFTAFKQYAGFLMSDNVGASTTYALNLRWEQTELANPTSYPIGWLILKNTGWSIRLICDSGNPASYTGNDGKVYRTVTINGVTYTADNLLETKYRNGDWIHGYDGGVYTPIANAAWAALTTEAMCFYNDDPANASGTVSSTLCETLDNLQVQIDSKDPSITNEGSLTVSPGSPASSVIDSNTSGQTGVTIAVGGINAISESGNTITITATEVDGSVINEIQNLTISNDTLFLSLSNDTVKLPDETDPIFAADSANIVHFNELDYFTNADEIDPVYAGDSAYIKTHVRDDLDLSATNEIQDLSGSGAALSGYQISLSEDATPVTLPDEADGSITNEIQAPTLVGNNLGLTQTSTTVDLSPYVNPATGDLTEDITGLEFSNQRQIVGGNDTLKISSGHVIPTTTNISHGESGYNNQITVIDVSGTTTKTITLTKLSGATLTATFTDSGGGSAGSPIIEVPTGLINSSNTEYTLSGTPVDNLLKLYLNGVLQFPTKYSLTGSQVSMNDPPFTDDHLIAEYINFTGSGLIYNEIPAGLINGSNTEYTTANTPTTGSDKVFLNGLLQKRGFHYTISGNLISFIIAPFTDDQILVDYKF